MNSPRPRVLLYICASQGSSFTNSEQAKDDILLKLDERFGEYAYDCEEVTVDGRASEFLAWILDEGGMDHLSQYDAIGITHLIRVSRSRRDLDWLEFLLSVCGSQLV